MKRLYWAGVSISEGALLCAALLALVFPTRMLAISAQLDQERDSVGVVREFATGARIQVARADNLEGGLRLPHVATPWLDVLRPRPEPSAHIIFEDSEGGAFHIYLNLIDERTLVVSFDDVFGAEFDLSQAVSDQQDGIPTWLTFDGRKIDLKDPSLMSDEGRRQLEELGERLDQRLGPRLREELVAAAEEMAAGRAIDEMNGTRYVTGELRSMGSIDCALATVSYLGSVVSLAACLTLVACIWAIVFHYASIAGAVTACVGWIEERAQERANCIDDDPETPCNEEG